MVFMKIRLMNNAEIVISANENKEGDYNAALEIANKMVDMSNEPDSAYPRCDIASAEEGDFIHICAVWDNFQKVELKDLYSDAKAILSGKSDDNNKGSGYSI